ncbi:protein of unknown function DUF668 [Dillenia turbinata]|uniref:DUF668 domain-containing protein n=1 Tax=Dillenia turbinata TaxID=194707 RepID=A0AAN8VMF8_9MAGN
MQFKRHYLLPQVLCAIYNVLIIYRGLKICHSDLISMRFCFNQLTIPQIKAKMEKTLQWLVPLATNTTKSTTMLRNKPKRRNELPETTWAQTIIIYGRIANGVTERDSSIHILGKLMRQAT